MKVENTLFPSQHKVLPKEVVSSVVAILVDLKEGKEMDPLELKFFLEKWLIEHILEEDKKIGMYFLE